ncbi:hypothetical protein [Roseiconus lacunae]|uniref:hypothetical protein n=1 Tax=Roseiconus lacunae TaxID=2605694 RepID=UPI001E2ED615|nr:hypothetical protein [Roseiconus lacunae]MCD0459940.1 hypothetical protein [Roseiconus lacunae]
MNESTIDGLPAALSEELRNTITDLIPADLQDDERSCADAMVGDAFRRGAVAGAIQAFGRDDDFADLYSALKEWLLSYQ